MIRNIIQMTETNTDNLYIFLDYSNQEEFDSPIMVRAKSKQEAYRKILQNDFRPERHFKYFGLHELAANAFDDGVDIFCGSWLSNPFPSNDDKINRVRGAVDAYMQAYLKKTGRDIKTDTVNGTVWKLTYGEFIRHIKQFKLVLMQHELTVDPDRLSWDCRLLDYWSNNDYSKYLVRFKDNGGGVEYILSDDKHYPEPDSDTIVNNWNLDKIKYLN